MGDGALTRRTLLAAGAGALAIEALRPAGALAALAVRRRPQLSTLALGRLRPGETRTVPLAEAPAYGAVRMAFVHHTENPNGYGASEVPAMLLAIYVFHRFVRGWDDIGYNFVVDLYGRIWEARAGGIDEAVTGAHAGGFN